jgi:ribosome-binding protein aMBF1 (putative translation factor)
MGIIYLEEHLASAFSRAAKATSVSEVTPPDRAFSVERIADHRSAGILSRCRHFKTAGTRALTSEAKASGEGQRLITSRKERKLAMSANLGHSVLKRKDKLALDGKNPLGHDVRMAENESEAQFKQAFTDRVKTARIATGMKQWQIAELLQIPQDKYKQYEGRSYLPHHLIGRFCIVCRVDPVWLVTGKGQKPLRPPHVVESEPEPKPKTKRTRRSKAA